MRWIQKRPGIADFKYRFRKVEQCPRISSLVVTGRIEESSGLGRMVAQSGRPSLRNHVRSAEQTRIRANSSKSSRTGEIDQGEALHDLYIRKVTFLKRVSGHNPDTGFLSKRLDERAGFVLTDVQDSETEVRRIKSESPRSSKENWSVVSIMDAREGCSGIKLNQ